MHKTSAGEKRKALKAEALELARDAKAAMRASRTLPEARKKARTLEGQADSLMAEAETLKGAARLEDLHVWQMQKVKTTKKGSKIYGYWMASWREGGKTRNIHLGSCMKTDAEAAMQKARKMKTEALGISEI
jgi:Ran GTPase-activating protein (RanGAP) involved in mRNA processing and transport